MFSEAQGKGNFKYFETDLKEVVQKKVRMIKRTEGLNTAFVGETLNYETDSLIKSENYCLFDADLTDLKKVDAQFELAGVDPR